MSPECRKELSKILFFLSFPVSQEWFSCSLYICVQASQVVLFLDVCPTYDEVHGRLSVQADALSQRVDRSDLWRSTEGRTSERRDLLSDHQAAHWQPCQVCKRTLLLFLSLHFSMNDNILVLIHVELYRKTFTVNFVEKNIQNIMEGYHVHETPELHSVSINPPVIITSAAVQAGRADRYFYAEAEHEFCAAAGTVRRKAGSCCGCVLVCFLPVTCCCRTSSVSSSPRNTTHSLETACRGCTKLCGKT